MNNRVDVTIDEIKELTWVQCEITTCLKWRRIGREEVNRIGELPWYCSMNTDSKYNKCDVPEQNHRSTIYAADKCGYRYIFSQLPKGSLVWAKMPGHVRWPAILSSDPSDGEYLDTNDATPTLSSYHVEFLGQPHSHYWVKSGDVEVYGGSGGFAKHCQKSKQNKNVSCAYKKDAYHKKLQVSIEEAEPLKTMSCDERLQHCLFVYSPGQTSVTSSDAGKCKPLEAGASQGAIKPTKRRGRPPRTQSPQPTSKDKPLKQRVQEKRYHRPWQQEDYTFSEVSLTSDDEDSTQDETSHVITTREERRQADIKILIKAENKFERRLRRFCSHHGLLLRPQGPTLQGCQISRYQMYMAVQRRGGYNAVCANHAWGQVFYEVHGTRPGPGQSVSSAVKSYYTRILLPYELHEMHNSSAMGIQNQSFPNETVKRKRDICHKDHKPKHHHKKRKDSRQGDTPTRATDPQTAQQLLHAYNQPIGEEFPALQPIGGREGLSSATIGLSQALALEPVVTLEEEATLELQAMENLMGSLQDQQETHLTSQQLDRPTHFEYRYKQYSECSPSGKEPLHLMFYSSQHDEQESFFRSQTTSSLQPYDDTHQVPDLTDSPFATTTSSSPVPIHPSNVQALEVQLPDLADHAAAYGSSLMPIPPVDSQPLVRVQMPDMPASELNGMVSVGPGHRQVCGEVEEPYNDILLDLEMLGEEIDLLNEELITQAW